MKSKSVFPSISTLIGFGILWFSLNACYPGDLSVEELDVVVTNYDAAYFDRTSPGKYLMPDTIGVIGNGDPQLSDQMEAFIINQISRNFEELGWERQMELDENDLPDVVVAASAVLTKTTVGGCIPWWGTGPWYPGWGWGPGWCYPAYLYSYETGTLVIDMIDPEESDEETFKRVWHTGINGLVRRSMSGNEEFARSTIDQAFKQSPYLGN